jgi:hypothetical protein
MGALLASKGTVIGEPHGPDLNVAFDLSDVSFRVLMLFFSFDHFYAWFATDLLSLRLYQTPPLAAGWALRCQAGCNHSSNDPKHD